MVGVRRITAEKALVVIKSVYALGRVTCSIYKSSHTGILSGHCHCRQADFESILFVGGTLFVDIGFIKETSARHPSGTSAAVFDCRMRGVYALPTPVGPVIMVALDYSRLNPKNQGSRAALPDTGSILALIK